MHDHVVLIHALAVAFALATVGDASWLFAGVPGQRPAGYGLGLAGIYLVSGFVIVALYPLCRWFEALKRNRTECWWSYL